MTESIRPKPPQFKPSYRFSEILGRILARLGWPISRVEIIEQAARLEEELTFALALHFGRDPVHILSLLEDVFWRLPIDIRVKLLDEALWRTGLQDEVPFLIPSLKLVFNVRNLLTHSVEYGGTADYRDLETVKRGVPQTTRIGAEHLAAAIEAAERCHGYIWRIEGRIGDVSTWADLYGFSEH